MLAIGAEPLEQLLQNNLPPVAPRVKVAGQGASHSSAVIAMRKVCPSDAIVISRQQLTDRAAELTDFSRKWFKGHYCSVRDE